MLVEAIETGKTAFLQYCRTGRNLSENTLRAYDQDLICFIRFLAIGGDANELNGATVLAYLEYLRRIRQNRETTTRRRMVTLRSLSAWLKKNGAVIADPFDDLELDLKLPRRLPRPVDRIDVRTLLSHQATSVARRGPWTRSSEVGKAAGSRITRLAIKLMVATGVRVGVSIGAQN
ncbi:site-specific integrase [Aquibium sp. ELW1220]|uniref:tyrosine-type recombinase/integrase n=1 Tax=Aquibium sp. ELW1220 TaxID=2976766 RepID=UPI0025B01B33|nr:site-specific integrase [Aquibium sp. ELW1220]MDN2584295.1 site-specific integrase [Aquibium sp. ELW1220]